MAAKTELDAIDRRILRLLSQDGRSSYQAIADEVGLSRPAVMERVKRLEEGGHILGYRVQLDRAKAGFPGAFRGRPGWETSGLTGSLHRW